MCLKDSVRTNLFRGAISRVVQKGDVVVDVGAGSGILSFFAAESGVSKVYAVEVEPFLAQKLRESVNLNGLTEVVEVMQGDIREVCLPGGVDVVIAEIIEQGYWMNFRCRLSTA